MLTPASVSLIMSGSVLMTVLLLLVVTVLYESWPRLKTWVHWTVLVGFSALVLTVGVLTYIVIEQNS